MLSDRDEPYWSDHRDLGSVPERLTDLLRIWRDQPPSSFDLPESEEVFPAASYQYVLYGMGFPPPSPGPVRGRPLDDLSQSVRQVQERSRALASALPTNRAYLDALRAANEPVAGTVQ